MLGRINFVAFAALSLSVCVAHAQDVAGNGAAEAAAPVAGFVDYQNCDGYWPANRNGDAITRGFDLGRRPVAAGRGVESCTRALAQLDAAFPQFRLRRVSLLQSRALHRLAQGDVGGALADLDLADQSPAQSDDAYYRRSLGVNNLLIRAMARIQSGDRAAGEALVMEAYRLRPYSREVVGGALVAVGPDASADVLGALLAAAGRLDPSQSDGAFAFAFETGRFEQALEAYNEVLAPQSLVDHPANLQTQVRHAENQRAREFLFWVEADSRRAYALAALTRSDEARAMLEQIRQRFDGAALPLPAMPQRPSAGDLALPAAREQANREIQTRGPALRDAWAALVSARIAANANDEDRARAIISSVEQLPPSYALIDLMTILHAPQSALDQARHSLSASRFPLPPHDARTLFGLLVDAETQTRAEARVNPIERIGMIGGSASRGGCDEDRRDDELRNVCFAGTEASLAITEERALLRAARLAVEAGYAKLRVEERADFHRSETRTGMYATTIQLGFESRLVVRFLNENCNRCLNASEIEATLGELYPGPSRDERSRR